MPRNVVTLSSRLLVPPTRKNQEARRAIIAALGDRYPALSSDGGKRLAIHFPRTWEVVLRRMRRRPRSTGSTCAGGVLRPPSNEKSLRREQYRQVRVGSTLYKEALMSSHES